MRYFLFLAFTGLVTILVMLFNSCNGYANFKYLKDGLVEFYLSEKNENRLSLRLLWSHVIGCGMCGYYVDLYPACKTSCIFAVDYYGIVKKFNVNTGVCIWSKKLSKIFFSSFFKKSSGVLLSGGVVVNKNHLYVTTELSKVYALDVNTGSILWISTVSGEVISKPVVTHHGLVLVYTSNGVLQALDERSGIVKWITNFEVPDFSYRIPLLPIIFDDIVVFGDSAGVVNACCVDTGELMWQKKIATLTGITDIDKLSNIVSLVVIDKIIYVVACNGNTEALDVFSGSLIWSQNIGSLINVVVEGDFVYLVDRDHRIVVLNKYNGNFVWSKSNLMHKKLISMVLYKNYILIGDRQGYLYCLCKEDGSFVGRKRVGFGSLSHLMIICGSRVVVYENTGRLSVWNSLNSN